jgi:hypothetical protein
VEYSLALLCIIPVLVVALLPLQVRQFDGEDQDVDDEEACYRRDEDNSETAAVGGDNCGVVSIGGLCMLTAGTYLGSGAWDPGR